MRLTIRAKLTLLLLFLLLLALVPVGWKGMDFFRKDKESSLQDLNAQTVAVQAREIGRKWKDTQRWLAMLATAGDQRAYRSLFQSQFSGYDWVGTFVLRGKALAAETTLFPSGKNQASENSLQQTLKNPELIRALRDIPSGEIRLIPMNSDSNENKIVFAAKLNEGLFGLTYGDPNLLYDIRSDAKAYSVLLVDKNGKLILHSDLADVGREQSYESLPIVSVLNNPAASGLSGTRTYLDPRIKEEVLGAYAPTGAADTGLVVQIPKRVAFAAAEDLMKRFLFALLVIFTIAVTIGVIFAGTLTKPIRKLVGITKQIGQGNFNIQLPVTSKDEIGDLTSSFNKMGEELIVRDEKLERAKQQLVQSEKMSAFGQMSAGIAHEVKNPLAGILGYAQLATKKATEESGLKKYLAIIEKETKRCKEIVENLMRFARQEKTELEETDVNKVVQDAVALVDHQITISGVKLEKTYAEDQTLPKVMANGNQIQQVLTNLMLNAQQAMKEDRKGTISVFTRPGENGWVEIEVSDTGEGIPEENLKKIFEPFFTTKPAGKGTGLGLAVTYGIIKEHKGEIDVKSEIGKGTSFTIKLPTKEGAPKQV